jgi:hypothetical protein
MLKIRAAGNLLDQSRHYVKKNLCHQENFFDLVKDAGRTKRRPAQGKSGETLAARGGKYARGSKNSRRVKLGTGCKYAL